MQSADYLVLTFYLVGMLAVGASLMSRVKSTADLFAAGGKSPWWASGLSSFMTIFSAGTFVVWGGVAFRLGLVAIVINLCYGVAALLAGWAVAGRWNKLGIRTPAEFVRLRFGSAAVHFYTWTMMVYRMVGSAVALYALSVMLCAMMPLPEGTWGRDPQTGHFSLFWAIVLFGGVTVIYTMLGGLWAVLMTDVLQFLVLNMSVLVVVPLLLARFDSWDILRHSAPDGFWNVTAGQYSWLFLFGWTTIHFFIIGAEWAFVQRFLCVPSPRDARKAMWLFGILYLISPWVWMLPPMLYRFIQPDTPHEEAYVRACVSVLPVGLVGLLLAAMFSATASMVSAQLNVFSGVLTEDVYRRILPTAGEGECIWVGRVLSGVLGVLLIGLAILIPRLGGAEKSIVTITNLIVTPLLAPTLFGLLSSRMSAAAMWTTALTSFGCGLLVTFCPMPWMNQLRDWSGSIDTLIGVVLPLGILAVWMLFARGTDPGWRRLHDTLSARRDSAESAAVGVREFDPLLGYLVAASVGASGLLTTWLIWVNRHGSRVDLLVLGAFSAGLFLIAGGVGIHTLRRSANVDALNEDSEIASL
ncbi:sodium:solute symporter family transporter [Planctomicrobium sp. SH664]|uniref:sodium:solute symporter family transporter n=1 Tax=Planctomicrobium sp. SH664 TaxID=3448125 RepID=UPI003F5B32BB